MELKIITSPRLPYYFYQNDAWRKEVENNEVNCSDEALVNFIKKHKTAFCGTEEEVRLFAELRECVPDIFYLPPENPLTLVMGSVKYETDNKYDCIISNPPFSLAQEFIEKSMELTTDDGQIAMFLKIQFLEGKKREEFFKKYPPKYIYVFRNRMATWNNGNQLDPNGKRWATTMCHAWFIWEKGSTTEPIIRWL